MIPIPSGVRVWIATGYTDMRRGMQGLALTVQEQLKRDPHAGDLYIFRGRRGDLLISPRLPERRRDPQHTYPSSQRTQSHDDRDEADGHR